MGNTLRRDYNELLRQQYSSEPIYDIATCESTRPDGTRSSFSSDGKVVYTLASEYTDDGGHLNRLGREVSAKEFIRVIGETMASKKQSTMVRTK